MCRRSLDNILLVFKRASSVKIVLPYTCVFNGLMWRLSSCYIQTYVDRTSASACHYIIIIRWYIIKIKTLRAKYIYGKATNFYSISRIVGWNQMQLRAPGVADFWDYHQNNSSRLECIDVGRIVLRMSERNIQFFLNSYRFFFLSHFRGNL